jgi:hypothetical protein
MRSESTAVLDLRQLARIEAVHRGFMYQHLFAAACLLTAFGPGRVTSIQVEKDEDIEVSTNDGSIYIQVKTRNKSLSLSDVQSSLDRFDVLRNLHLRGARVGRAQFVVISNSGPSPSLNQHLEGGGQHGDVTLIWPGSVVGPHVEDLPPAWNNIPEAVSWCTAAAEALPHRYISAESLVWKLAANVALAASGEAPYETHSFCIADLPSLFEQFLLQLQDFPEPLRHYRPQQDEPALETQSRIRIVCGFSGAGKTSWAAQAAAHSTSNAAYYDATETPSAALPSAIVRECAAQLSGSRNISLNKIFAPGVTGLESLRSLDIAVHQSGLSALLVIDNAHKVDAATLQSVLQATSHLKLVLLCHPTTMVSELETLTGSQREELKGWSLEDVAAEAAVFNCRGSIEAMDKLRMLTAGYPLFVQGALRLAAGEYEGDLAALCGFVEQGIHGSATAQEVILARVFEGLSTTARNSLAFLSISDVPLSRLEVTRMLRECVGVDEAAVATLLRQLKLEGLIQQSGSDRMRVHDAIRILGKLHLQSLGTDETRRGLLSLRTLIFESLHGLRDTSRFGMFARLLAALSDLEPLIDLMGEELFHEIGVIPEVTEALRHSLDSGQLTAEQQFWAYDGLIFAALKHGSESAQQDIGVWLEKLDALMGTGKLTASQIASLWIKRMHYEAGNGNVQGVMNAIERATVVLPEDPASVRVFYYNAARALYAIEKYEPAFELAQRMVVEYYGVLGIEPSQIIGLKQRELWDAIGGAAVDISDVKHLADALELLDVIANRMGRLLPLVRVHAMRFYELAGAVDSVVRTGLDVADAFVRRNDFIGARQVMEDHVLPYVKAHRLMAKMLDARSLYAVILAYCGCHDQADLEMSRLTPLVQAASASMQRQIAEQRQLIAEVRAKGPPPQFEIGDLVLNSEDGRKRSQSKLRVGRNEPCPCGSGKKFKKCHGA